MPTLEIGKPPVLDGCDRPHCPECGSMELVDGYGFAFGGGLGYYVACDSGSAEGCGWFYKTVIFELATSTLLPLIVSITRRSRMQFNNSTPATTVNTITTPDGKYTYTATTTTSTTTTVAFASPDGTTIANNSVASIFDSVNTWTVKAGVIYMNGVAVTGTNNVAKLVWTKGVIWQENTGGLWWYWDVNNEIWVSGPAPV